MRLRRGRVGLRASDKERGTVRTRTNIRRSVCAVAALLTLAIPRSAEAATYDVRYIVPPLQAPELFPDVPLAPFGMFTIIPERTKVTVTIADDVTPEGSFLFKICQKNKPHPGDSYCGEGHDDVSTGDICYAGPKTLKRVVPGNPVEVTLWFSASPCPDAPTTGTMTIVG